MHLQKASAVPGWDTMNKNDLINKYIDAKGDKRSEEAYLSAIICRYWWAISKYEKTSHKSIQDSTIYYDWLVNAILKATKNKKWRDPKNKLYTDVNGPDKVVNRCIISQRLEWYQSANKQRRRLNINASSIEHLQDELGDGAPIPQFEDNELNGGMLEIKSMVNKFVSEGDFVDAFIVSGIVGYNLFDTVKDSKGKKQLVFNQKKLLRYLHNMTIDDCEFFSYIYGIPLKTVIDAKDKCQSISRYKMKVFVRRGMNKIKEAYLED